MSVVVAGGSGSFGSALLHTLRARVPEGTSFGGYCAWWDEGHAIRLRASRRQLWRKRADFFETTLAERAWGAVPRFFARLKENE